MVWESGRLQNHRSDLLRHRQTCAGSGDTAGPCRSSYLESPLRFCRKVLVSRSKNSPACGRPTGPLWPPFWLKRPRLVSAGPQAQQSVPSRAEGERRAGGHRAAFLRRPQSRGRHEPPRHRERHPEPQGQKVNHSLSHSCSRVRSHTYGMRLSAGLLRGSSPHLTAAVRLRPRLLYPPTVLPSSAPRGSPGASLLLQTARRTTERQTATRTHRR